MKVIKVDELHEATSNIVSKQEFSHLVNELLIELDSVLETKSITIGWVPLTDENMPKQGEYVLCRYEVESLNMPKFQYYIGRYSKSADRWYCNACVEMPTPSHWMPIPVGE